MKSNLIVIMLGLTTLMAGCASVQNLRSSVGGSASCEAVNMTRAEYDAYEALGPEKPYYCAINVPRAAAKAADQQVAAE